MKTWTRDPNVTKLVLVAFIGIASVVFIRLAVPVEEPPPPDHWTPVWEARTGERFALELGKVSALEPASIERMISCALAEVVEATPGGPAELLADSERAMNLISLGIEACSDRVVWRPGGWATDFEALYTFVCTRKGGAAFRGYCGCIAAQLPRHFREPAEFRRLVAADVRTPQEERRLVELSGACGGHIPQ